MSEPNPSLIGMITNPVEQFDRIRKKPLIWIAMGVIMLFFVIGMWLSSLNVDLATEISQETGLPLDDELMAVASMMENVGIMIGGVISPIFGILLSTVIHVLVAKVVDSQVTFRQLFSMNTYITFITALGVILNGIIYVLLDASTASFFTSLGFFLDLDGAGGVIANNLEIFSIWTVILTAIGLERVAKLSRGLSWSISIIMFLMGIVSGIISLNV